jgi:hypothetical protein
MMLLPAQWHAKSVSFAHPAVRILLRKLVRAQGGSWRAAKEDWRDESPAGLEAAMCTQIARRIIVKVDQDILRLSEQPIIRMIAGQLWSLSRPSMGHESSGGVGK